MLVTLITHPGDRALAVNLCARIQQLGGVQNHECLIVSPIGTNLDDIEGPLKRSFGQVHIHQYQPMLKGWPAGPNEAAAHAMLHIWTNNALRYHYLILEPDCVPMTDRWLDMIDIAYRQGGNGGHVLGSKTNTFNAAGQVIGKHTVGVAVYPKNWPEICPPIKSMIDMTNGYVMQRQSPPPWDAYCGAYTNRCTAETPLIQHFTLMPTSEGGYFHFDCPLESALQQVRAGVALVHGCKHPEFLSKLTGTKFNAPQIRKIESNDPPKHLGTPPRQAVPENRPQVRPESSGETSRGDSLVASPKKEVTPEEKKRRKEIAGMRWPRLKKYAASLHATVHRTSRPDIETQVIEIERRERKEQWTLSLPQPEPERVINNTRPVEEAAPPMVAPPLSTASRTAIPWNSADGQPQSSALPPDSAGISNSMQQKMMQLIADRKALGLPV